MIGKVFTALKDELKQYLLRLPELTLRDGKIIEISSIVDSDGNVVIPSNSLGLCLANIEEERVIKSQKAVIQAASGTISHLNPEIKLNIYIIITANFDVYSTGLQYLSGAIRFFQSKNVFKQENTPGLDPEIKKLILELHTLNFEEQNNIWGAMGAKYLPSVMYKVRMLSVQEGIKSDEQPPIKDIAMAGRRI